MTLDVPGATVTYPDAVNNFGQIAGFFQDAMGVHGFVVAPFLGLTRIDPPYGPLDNSYFGIGINDFGQLVGQALVTNSSGRVVGSTGFLDSFGSFTKVNVPNASITQPLGINDTGQIIGFYVDQSGTHGFLRTNGVFKTIQDPNASGASIPFGINNFGHIVGWFDEGAATHGFLYRNGVFTTIENPVAPDATFATGINDLGQIVGFYIDATGFHGFVDTNDIFTTLDDPSANGGGTFAYAINDRDEVVGQFGNHGFMTTSEDDITSLGRNLSGVIGQAGSASVPGASGGGAFSVIANLLRLLGSGK
jgi:probable HAF family extracellular repeat protein